MTRLRSAVPLALALAFGFVTPAGADIDPPNGRRWISYYGATIVNADEFPDWVLVGWPCSQSVDFALDPYCIVKKGEFLSDTSVYAVAKRDVTIREVTEKNGRKLQASVLVFDPDPDDPARFFRGDSRVIRPPFETRREIFQSAEPNLGVRGAWYFLRIESIDRDKGVKAKYVRAKYECRSGAQVEVDWGANQDLPPIPQCPVTDDRGDAISKPGSGEGVVIPVRPPPSRARNIWLGLMVVSLGLIGVGALWKKRA